ncbi:MAG TPA: acyl carrier protein [Solimonas sp.]
MSTAPIYEQLTTIMRDLFDNDGLVVTPELTAKEVEGWDSLAHIRLILLVEKTFKIKFSASQINNLKNVGELVALIQSKL